MTAQTANTERAAAYQTRFAQAIGAVDQALAARTAIRAAYQEALRRCGRREQDACWEMLEEAELRVRAAYRQQTLAWCAPRR